MAELKYKLLRELPNTKIGVVKTEFNWEQIHGVYPKKHPDWFEKIEDIPEWVICIKEDSIWKGTLNRLYEPLSYKSAFDWNIKGFKFSVSKSRFREATPAEVEAHKLGLHIGDKVWHRFFPQEGYYKLVSFRKTTTGILADFKCGGNFINIVNLTTKEPIPKIITEEGDKLYSDGKCWFIRPNHELNISFNIWSGTTDIIEGKYFSSKSNAQQYFVELQAKKRGIKIGTEVFGKGVKNYLGKVMHITHQGNSVQLNTEKLGYVLFGHVITLKELAKEEGLEIGTKLSGQFIKDWLLHSAHFYIEEDYIEADTEVESFYMSDNKPLFKITNGRGLQIIGFKKFKEQWEATQKIETLGIPEEVKRESCSTCKFYTIANSCLDCSYRFTNKWQPKQLKFVTTLKPKLMLGEEEVTLQKNGIKVKGDFIPTEKWILHYKKFREILNTGVKSFTTELYGYLIDYKRDDITLGCIHGIKLKEIEEVVKAINNL